MEKVGNMSTELKKVIFNTIKEQNIKEILNTFKRVVQNAI